MTPFDPDDWKRRYHAAYRSADARALRAIVDEWSAAHPGREYLPARDPNRPPYFPPEMTARLYFVRCAQKVACARCGKKRKRHWTMLVPFKAAKPRGKFVVDVGTEVFYPLTPVCDDHPLGPAELPDELSPG